MSAWVSILGDGIAVGGTVVAGAPLPDGRVRVGDATVRALSLAERARLIDLAGDPDSLAALVGAAAGDRDASPGAAADAVALELAGAALDGPLARTSLLVGRAMGAAADTLDAARADRLAATLARGLAPTAEDGWTTITFASADGDDARAASGGPVEARTALAARLLAREREPVDAELARALMAEAPANTFAAPPTADAAAPGTVPVPAGAAASPQRPSDTVDPNAFSPRAPDGVRPDVSPNEPAGAALSPARGAAPRAPHGTAATPAHRAVDDARDPNRADAPAVAPSPSAVSPNPEPARRSPAAPFPARGAHVPVPSHAARASSPGAANPVPDRWASGASPYGVHVPAPTLAARPAPDLVGEWWAEAPANERAGSRTPAPAHESRDEDLDATALALHRAADLRGAPR